MTLKWDDYLTVLDEDDLDEAEEQRNAQRLEYSLKQRKDLLKEDLELLIANEQEDNQDLQDLYDLFANNPDFKQYTDTTEQKQRPLDFLKNLEFKFTDLFDAKKLIKDGFLVIQRNQQQIVKVDEFNHIDEFGQI